MSTQRAIGSLGALWGAAGMFALLGFAIWRLALKAHAAYEMGLTAGQWALTVAVLVFMGYSEGYKGFQKKFSPRTAARVRYLRDRPNGLRSLLAPVFAMGFFHSNRRTKIVAFAMTFGILILVLLVHRLDQPWRGIIDAGVVLGLSWGVVSLAAAVRAALTRADYTASPEVPGPP
jgi:hypothetical protein